KMNEYIDCVNRNWNSERKDIIEKFLLEYSNLIPVGIINHIFLKRNLEDIWIDQNDIIRFK
ncbi:MAG: hypothetical protein IJG31_05055, partial [Fusobacterium sp.]|nr:hypothetical protein [Fusobacterium sp.]